MSDYHIGLKSADARYATVYVHLPVPVAQTVAGAAIPDATLTYQRAMKESLQLRKDEQGNVMPVTQIPEHQADFPTDHTALTNGERVEYILNFRFSALDLTNAARRDEIENGNPNQPGGVTQMKADMSISTSDLYGEVVAPLDWWGWRNNTT